MVDEPDESNLVDVSVEGEIGEIEPDAVERDASAVLDALGLRASELSLVLCDDAFIQPLNRDWRGQDTSTDVLSFPQEELPPDGSFEGGVLGDVVISIETAARQAAALGHPLQTEVQVLLVHGVLHLLGFDHMEPEEADRMRSEEVRILSTLGVATDAALIGRTG